jgi:hypothetical protein
MEIYAENTLWIVGACMCIISLSSPVLGITFGSSLNLFKKNYLSSDLTHKWNWKSSSESSSWQKKCRFGFGLILIDLDQNWQLTLLSPVNTCLCFFKVVLKPLVLVSVPCLNRIGFLVLGPIL